jgi:peptide/nickel transport system ATP-binding protein
VAGSGTAQLRPGRSPVLTVEHLTVDFRTPRGETVSAVADVSFDVLRGETLGLVGESGCGKSTTGQAIAQFVAPTSGHVRLGDVDLATLDEAALRQMRPEFQMIFQDPLASLNPRRKVRDIVAEPLKIWRPQERATWRATTDDVLDSVGLDPAQVGNRYPRQFSGGQSQRISIARALVLGPRLLVCDEPVSALDVSVQAQIINLLDSMRSKLDLAMIFIAHDLSVVKNVSDRLAVMYLGKLCEIGDADAIYGAPAHPYTQALLASVPRPDRRPVAMLDGEVPSSTDPPSGCRFRTRCPRADQLCAEVEPQMRPIHAHDPAANGASDEPDHFVACHHPTIDGAVQVTLGTADGSRTGTRTDR